MDEQQQNTSGKRIGLFGGSFNPPHYGHFIAAFYAYHFLGLDEVWMMVSPQNPLKNPDMYEPLPERLELCKLLADGHPWLIPTDVEKNFNTNQTADTLLKIKDMCPDDDFVWIMGADNLTRFHEWARWEEIIENHAIAVLARKGDGEQAAKSPAAKYAKDLKIDKPENMRGKNKGWCFIDVPSFNISSSQILKEMRSGKRNIHDLPAAIEKKILEKELFGVRGQNDPAPQTPPPPAGPAP